MVRGSENVLLAKTYMLKNITLNGRSDKRFGKLPKLCQYLGKGNQITNYDN